MIPAIIDFETMGIDGRPHYPPEPVGVAIKMPNQASKYYAWGHVGGGNTHSLGQGLEAIDRALRVRDGYCFHHSKFDAAVLLERLGFKPAHKPNPLLCHDTLYLRFLDNPHARDLGLKPSCEELFDLPPDEQEEVRDWLVTNQPVPGIKIGKGKQSEYPWGAYIAYAPAPLVGKYACGDTDRTDRLFQHLYPKIVENEMLVAYQREQRLMPVLLRMEQGGVRVDMKRLARDVEMYRLVQAKVAAWVRRKLKRGEDLNIDSPAQLVKALVAAGFADTSKMGVTKGGQVKADKDAIAAGVTDLTLAGVLRYYTQLSTCLGTFMEPWLEVALQSGGLIFTEWHSTRNPSGYGARTGRLSSTPNFQNIPNEFNPIFKHETKSGQHPDTGWPLPPAPFDLPSLPMVRSYVIPDEPGHMFLDRDFSQQEPRLLGHFEGGVLNDAYVANPWLDVHDHAKAELERMTRRPYKRKPVKNTNLGLIYGMGVGKLALKNGTSVEEAKALKAAILTIFPGLKEMYNDMKARAKAGEPIRTWGGRLYYCEEPKIVNGRMQEYDYKLVNTLIQGSASDQVKEVMITYDEAKVHGKTKVQVHDQLLNSCPRQHAKSEMELLREVMEDRLEFAVPMLSEGRVSTTNWADLQDYDKKGELVWQGRLAA